MKHILLSTTLLTSLLFVQCGTKVTDADNQKAAEKNEPINYSELDPTPYAETITADELKEMLYTYASDEFEGRDTGEPGQKKAVEYLKNYYKDHKIDPAIEGNYFQEIPSSYFKKGSGLKDSENVLAFIEGATKPDEILVISAHLDHVGVRDDGEIYNGADDDGSGTVAILEIAEAFKDAVEAGFRPQRSILFLHVTAEEKGLVGSRFYAENPVFPMANTVADLNIDMIGRQDPDHADDDNYIYLIGSDMLSTELHDVSEKANEEYVNMNLDYRYNGTDDPNRFYYRSDHYNFAKNGVPVIFYFNGVHADYHKVTDTPDKINYPLLAKRAKLIFYTAWELANREERVKVDKA